MAARRKKLCWTASQGHLSATITTHVARSPLRSLLCILLRKPAVDTCSRQHCRLGPKEKTVLCSIRERTDITGEDSPVFNPGADRHNRRRQSCVQSRCGQTQQEKTVLCSIQVRTDTTGEDSPVFNPGVDRHNQVPRDRRSRGLFGCRSGATRLRRLTAPKFYQPILVRRRHYGSPDTTSHQSNPFKIPHCVFKIHFTVTLPVTTSLSLSLSL
jgi:hypothetical protein